MKGPEPTTSEIHAIEMAWNALPNLVIDRDEAGFEDELAVWHDAAKQYDEDVQVAQDELHHDLFGVCNKSAVFAPKNANNEDDQTRQHFELFKSEEALNETRMALLLELIKLKAHDVAIRLAVKHENGQLLDFIFGELAKTTKAQRVVEMIVATAIPARKKSHLFLELFEQTEEEEYLGAFRASLLARQMRFLKKPIDRDECQSLACGSIKLWWFKREPKLLSIATTFVRMDQTWLSQMRLARATGSLEEYRVLIDNLARCSDEERIANGVDEIASTLVLLQNLIVQPDMVPDVVKRYIEPLSKQDLEAFLAMSPPKQRRVYQKRLKAAAERAAK